MEQNDEELQGERTEDAVFLSRNGMVRVFASHNLLLTFSKRWDREEHQTWTGEELQ